MSSSSSDRISPIRSNGEVDSSGPVSSEAGSDEFRVLSICTHRSSPSTRTDSQKDIHSRDQRNSSDETHNAGEDGKSETNFGNEHLTAWVQSVCNAGGGSESRFTEVVRRNRNFRNPAIFDKMIKYCGIDENGTELSRREPLQEFEYYEAIAEFQEVCARGML